MKQALPPLFQTFSRTFTLYSRSYVDILPIVLLLVLMKFSLNTILPTTSTIDLEFMIRIILDTAISSLAFCVMAYGIYEKHTQGEFFLAKSFKEGIMFFPQVFLAYLVVSIPFLVLFFLLGHFAGSMEQLAHENSEMGHQQLIVMFSIMLTLIMAIVISCYFFLSGIIIIIKKSNVVVGLSESWHLVSNYLLDTFLLIAFIGILSTGLAIMLQYIMPAFFAVVVNLIISPLYPCLMIIHYENLEKAHHR